MLRPSIRGSRSTLEELFEQLGREYGGQEVDRKWRMDILDTFSYMRNVDRRGFAAREAILNGLLSRYPLREEGYIAAAAALFWGQLGIAHRAVHADQRVSRPDRAR